ncbi:hypothetical protein L1987_75431 [Smallanthus sonchifolius]|uniref:Uncharacterized protein n=1 Tax=Smallanthus sonchifolius TaxID=185202 RepID=A0ACB9A4X2_9ASTR|nr:hypothetical protein L1987_75431 [Smallanthus sonchifolius]
MGRDQRKRSREVKGKDVESDPVVVVTPPTEDEVDEFFAILRRMREAVKYLEKRKLTDSSQEVKRSEVGLLDLNTVPVEGE